MGSSQWKRPCKRTFERPEMVDALGNGSGAKVSLQHCQGIIQPQQLSEPGLYVTRRAPFAKDRHPNDSRERLPFRTNLTSPSQVQAWKHHNSRYGQRRLRNCRSWRLKTSQSAPSPRATHHPLLKPLTLPFTFALTSLTFALTSLTFHNHPAHHCTPPSS